ncbi:MAG: hypothetical protein NPMRd3_660001 [Nitrosopumilales archaeon]|nr:MAG: hypothetical protein NPMRd3_660001 [Nitrosopumilales archaeon]
MPKTKDLTIEVILRGMAPRAPYSVRWKAFGVFPPMVTSYTGYFNGLGSFFLFHYII